MSKLSGRIPEPDGIRGIAIGVILPFRYFFQAIGDLAGSFLSPLRVVTRTQSRRRPFFVPFGLLMGEILPDAPPHPTPSASSKFAVSTALREAKDVND